MESHALAAASSSASPMQQHIAGVSTIAIPEQRPSVSTINILIVGSANIRQLQRVFDRHRTHYIDGAKDVRLISLADLVSSILGLTIAEAEQLFLPFVEDQHQLAPPSPSPPPQINLNHLAEHARVQDIDLMWICHEKGEENGTENAWEAYEALLQLFSPPSVVPSAFARSPLAHLPVIVVGLSNDAPPSSFSSSTLRLPSPASVRLARARKAKGCISIPGIAAWYERFNPTLQLAVKRAIYVAEITGAHPQEMYRIVRQEDEKEEEKQSSLPSAPCPLSFHSPPQRSFSHVDDFHLDCVGVEMSHHATHWQSLTIHSSRITNIGLDAFSSKMQHLVVSGAFSNLHSINFTAAFTVDSANYSRLLQALIGVPLASLTLVQNTIVPFVSSSLDTGNDTSREEEDETKLHNSYSLLLDAAPIKHLALTHLSKQFFSIPSLAQVEVLDLSGAWTCGAHESSTVHPFQAGLSTILASDSPLLSSHSKLAQLHLSNNSLGDNLVAPLLHRLAAHPTLTILSLFRNKLTDSPELILALQKLLSAGCSSAPTSRLIALDLSDNALLSFPSELYSLPLKLRHLNLRGNPLSNIPHYILQQPHQPALLDYLALLRRNNSSDRSPRRVRLMLLGNGAAGKTFLKDSLFLSRPQYPEDLVDWSVDNVSSFFRSKGLPEDVISELARKGFEGCNMIESDRSALHCDVSSMLAIDDELQACAEQVIELVFELQEQIEADRASGRTLYTSTVGVLSDSFTHTIDTPTGPMDIIVDILDFAGQQEYFVPHALFLKDVQAAYVLVNNLAKKISSGTTQDDGVSSPTSPKATYEFNTENESQCQFWLSFLQSMFPPGSQIGVTLVQTHVDELRKLGSAHSLPNPLALRSSLQEKFGKCYRNLDVLQVDYSQKDPNHAQSGHAVKQMLLAKIGERALASSSPFLKAEAAIGKLIGSFRRKGDFPVVKIADLARKVKISDVELFDGPQGQINLQGAMTHFAATGLILPVPNVGMVILDPLQWFNSCVAAFIATNTSDDLHRNDQAKHAIRSHEGIIEWGTIQKHASQLLCKNDDQLRLLMTLLSHLGLCYPIESPAPLPPRYLFPCLLPSSPTQHDQIESFMDSAEFEREFNLSIHCNYFANQDAIRRANGVGVALDASSSSSSNLFDYPKWNERGANRFIYTLVGRDWTCSNDGAASNSNQVMVFPPTFFPHLQIRLLQRFQSTSTMAHGQGFMCIRPKAGFEQAFLQHLPSSRTVRLVVGGHTPQMLLAQLIDVVEQAVLSSSLDEHLRRYALCPFCLSMLCFPQSSTGNPPSELVDHLSNKPTGGQTGMYARFAELVDRFELKVNDWQQWRSRAPCPPASTFRYDLSAASHWSELTASAHCKFSRLEQDSRMLIGAPSSIGLLERLFDQVRHVMYHPLTKQVSMLTGSTCITLTTPAVNLPASVQSLSLHAEFDHSGDFILMDEPAPLGEWSCLACTSFNPPRTLQCQICHTRRTPESIAMEHSQHHAIQQHQTQQRHIEEWRRSHPRFERLSSSSLSGNEFSALASPHDLFTSERPFPSKFDCVFVVTDDNHLTDEVVLLRSGHFWKKKLDKPHGDDLDLACRFLDMPAFMPRLLDPSEGNWSREIYPFLMEQRRVHQEFGTLPASTSVEPGKVVFSPDLDAYVIAKFALTPNLLQSASGTSTAKEDHDIFSCKLNTSVCSPQIRSAWTKHPALSTLLRIDLRSSTQQSLVDVTVKRLKKTNHETCTQFVQRFIYEVETHIRLIIHSHPNIFPLVGYCILLPFAREGAQGQSYTLHELEIFANAMEDTSILEQSQLILVFPRIDTTLEQVLTRRDLSLSMPNILPRISEIILQASSALTHCHHLGIIHRDVAARSFLIDDQMRVYLHNFELARSLPKWSQLQEERRWRSRPSHASSLLRLPSSALERILTHVSFSDRTLHLRHSCTHLYMACSDQLASFGVFPPNELLEVSRLAPESLISRVYSRSTDVHQFGRFLTEILAIWPCDLSTDRSSFDEWIQMVRVQQGFSANVQIEYHRWPRALCDLVAECTMMHPDHRPSIQLVQTKIERFQGSLLAATSPSLLSSSALCAQPFIDSQTESPAEYVGLDIFSPNLELIPRVLRSSWPLSMARHVETAFQHPVTREIFLVAGGFYWKLSRDVDAQTGRREAAQGYPKPIPSVWRWPIPSRTGDAPFTPWQYAPLNIFPVEDSLFLLKGDLVWKIIGSSKSSVNSIQEDDLTVDSNPRYPINIAEWKGMEQWRESRLEFTMLKLPPSEPSTSSPAPSATYSSASSVVHRSPVPNPVISSDHLQQCLLLADCFLWSRSGCAQSLPRAAEILFVLARAHNMPQAWYALGLMHSRHWLPGTTEQEMQDCFLRAAKAGAIAALAVVHQYGFGSFSKNPWISKKYAELAVASNPNDPSMCTLLGTLLQTVAPVNLLGARTMLERSFTLHDDSVRVPLALMYASVHPKDLARTMVLIGGIRDANHKVEANQTLLNLLESIRQEEHTLANKRWHCKACTFENTGSNTECEMCGQVKPEQEESKEETNLNDSRLASDASLPMIDNGTLKDFVSPQGIIAPEHRKLFEASDFRFDVSSLPPPSHLLPSPLHVQSTQREYDQLYAQWFTRREVTFYSWSQRTSNDTLPVPRFEWNRPYDLKSFQERTADAADVIESNQLLSRFFSLRALIPATHVLRSADLDEEDILGSGLSSVVRKSMFVGRQFKGSMFAVKTFRSEGEKSQLPASQLFDHFQHELEVYLSLPKHPHLLDFFGVVLEKRKDGAMAGVKMKLVLQYMSRNSLATVLAEPNGPLSLEWPNPSPSNLIRLVVVLRECASALCFLHSRGLVHCDVAARNFLVDSAWSVRIGDFGLARMLPRNPAFDPKKPKRGVEEFSRMGFRTSGAGELLPRLAMPPELLISSGSTPYSKAADIWSFGLMIWSALSGRPPWSDVDFPHIRHHDPIEREQRIVNLLAKGHLKLPLSDVWPPALRDLLSNCFDPNPKVRETRASLPRIIEDLTTLQKELEAKGMH